MGAGPSGMLLAAEAARMGLTVAVVTGPHFEPWTPHYGFWEADLSEASTTVCELVRIRARWARPLVRFSSGDFVELAHGYCEMDSKSTFCAIRDACERGGVKILRESVARVIMTPDGFREVRTDSTCFSSQVVVDATGSRSRWSPRPFPDLVAWQTAYGMNLPAKEHPMILMDFWRQGGTFLYALPQGGGSVFLEETSLAARPELSVRTLQERFEHRYADSSGSQDGVERCRIAMGGGVPNLGGLVVPFGAAAGMVHPATGYQLGMAIRLATPFVTSIAESLKCRDDVSRKALRSGFNVLWPLRRWRTWYLFHFGLEVLLRLDESNTRLFFKTFFELPTRSWLSYLRGTDSPAQICGTMWRLFCTWPLTLKLRVMAAAISRPALRMLAVAVFGRRGAAHRRAGPGV